MPQTLAQTVATQAQIKAAYAVLRQWALDAQDATTAANWVGTTYTVKKDAALKLTIQRLGILSDRLADLLLLENLDQ